MNHKEIYEEKRRKAKEKKAAGLQLSRSEKIAYASKWYFSIPLDIDVYESVIEMAEEYGVMPCQIVEAWIMKGYGASRGKNEG